jgi:exodeoxyribonuclease V alpha subunit
MSAASGEFELDASQSAAVELMVASKFCLVTGPPGSGKTTTLRAALAAWGPNVRVAMAAPTGKAARRMAQQTRRQAVTLHRLLGYRGDGEFTVDEIDADVIVIDESSMIDYELGLALLDRCGAARLVLVGDANQLPPVGPGRLFGDLVDAEAAPVARLNTQHRARKHSWVARNAPAVLTGGPIETETCAGFQWIQVDKAADVPRAVRECIAASGYARGDESPPMVLTPQRTGAAGCHALGIELDPLLNLEAPLARAGEAMITRGDEHVPLRVGSRVIQTSNNYDLGVMNGEIGWITELPDRKGPITVRFPELETSVMYSGAEAGALDCAYALTVHKTQGSEFPHVIVVMHSTHTRMLNRSILYTAITRASRRVTIIGDEKGLARALKINAAKRATTLVERIAGTLEGVRL